MANLELQIPHNLSKDEALERVKIFFKAKIKDLIKKEAEKLLK
jgi:hypothetical protein